MKETDLSAKRRVQIFMTGIAPLMALCAILFMAAKFDLNIIDLFTKVEQRDAKNFVVVTKVFGVALSSRPATPADLAEEDAVMRTVKIAVLVGSAVVIGGSMLMCVSAATGRPQKALRWFDRKLGSAQLFQGAKR
jgi:hypothetical protein